MCISVSLLTASSRVDDIECAVPVQEMKLQSGPEVQCFTHYITLLKHFFFLLGYIDDGKKIYSKPTPSYLIQSSRYQSDTGHFLGNFAVRV